MTPVARLVLLMCAVFSCSQCASSGGAGTSATDCVVSVKEQKLAFYRNGSRVREYPVSTSKFGLSDKPGTYGTPLGLHEVVAKIGHGAPVGAVFHSRQWTGEVIKPDSPGRDPIVTRIMWLRGLEKQNQNAYGRCIYIHGTAEERNVGKPVSYGCIRMKSRDVLELFSYMSIGSRVLIVPGGLPSTVPTTAPVVSPPASSQPPLMLNPEGSVASNGGPSAQAQQPQQGQSAPTSAQVAAAQPAAPANTPPGSQVIYTHTGGIQSGPGISLKSKAKKKAEPEPVAKPKKKVEPEPEPKAKAKSKAKAKTKPKKDAE